MLSRTRGKGLSTAKIADGLLLRLRQGGERCPLSVARAAPSPIYCAKPKLCHGDECYYRCYLSAAFGGGAGHCNGGRFCRRSG